MRLIKDQIHLNIIFTEIESYIFSNMLFNRLHHILQNSMAYMVYPTNKTSRFIHSIGTAKVASDIFYYGLINAEEEVLQNYLQSKLDLIKSYNDDLINLIENRTLWADKDKKELFPNNQINLEKLYDFVKNKLLGKDFINAYSFESNIFENNKELFVVYMFLLQLTRLQALLHDFGHLPFSHLFEFAIEKISNKAAENKIEINDNEVKNRLISLTDKKDIHEQLGKVLIKKLIKYIECSYKESIGNESSTDHSIVIIVFKILQKMIDELHIKKNNYLYSIYELISSDFDADRIDYTLRDGYSSSLIKDGADVDRVLKTFCLSKRDDGIKDEFKFYPAIQALYDIDEIFLDRARVYKALINHHKVKRYDYLLQKAIEILLIEELKTKKYTNNIQINNLVDLVYEILNLIIYPNSIDDNKHSLKRLFFKISQITDYWLLSHIEIQLVSKLSAKDENNNETFKILNDLFTGSKEFKSLWKRDYDAKSFYEILKETFRNYEQPLFDKDMVEMNKILVQYKDSPFEMLYNILKIKTEMLNYIEEQFAKNNNTILLTKTKLAKVPKEEFKLINLKNGEKLPYKEVSEKVESLNKENQSFLPFYVFRHKNCELGKEEIEKQLANYIIDYLKGGNNVPKI